MLSIFGHFAPFAAAMALLASVATAQEGPLPLDPHPWGKFPIGSWKEVRVLSETLDANGRVTNLTVTETKTTLVDATPEHYALRVEVTIEVAGKRFPPQVQTVKLGYFGESPDQKVTSKKTGDAELLVNGQHLPCEVRQITITGDGFQRDSTIHYAEDISPYQLKRETVATHGSDAAKTATTNVDVIALNLPHRVLGELKPAATIRTVQKHAKGTTVTLEIHCDDVPGGVVSHSAVDRDESGQTTRRSTLEIVDYSIGIGRLEEPSLIRRRKFHRNRPRRNDSMPTFPQR